MLKSKLIFRLIFIFLACTTLCSFRNDDDPILDKILAKLAYWSKNLPQEKVYLQTDKPYYAVGDTVYFKAYVTAGSRHNFSSKSGALYVDLINERNLVEKSIKLPVQIGMSAGSIPIDRSYSDGNYRLRAYTEWMRNAGPDYYFDRPLVVLKIRAELLTSINYQYTQKDGKPQVIATINYQDGDGKVLADKNVKCEIKTAGKIALKHLQTDAKGNVTVELTPEQVASYKNTYIQTTVLAADKHEMIKTFAVKPGLLQSDVQFFPEGGTLLNGVYSRIGFKAVSPVGVGTDVKGVVIDNSNNEVASFNSAHAGMGNFNFMPEAGKTYQAKVTYTDGSTAVIDMPKASDNGYVLAVHNTPGDSVLVRIYSTPAQLQQQQSVALVAHTGGEVGFAATIKLSKPMTSVWVPKKPFPTGIAQFTLFNAAGDALNERVVFIKNNDQLQLALNTIKSSNKSREKVELEVDAKNNGGNPVVGAFSVSAINESVMASNEDDESTILSNMLLTSDLKGYIEKPNYYFNSKNTDAVKDLDNLMLTQGYRRFVWKELLADKPVEAKFKAEGIKTEVSGKLLTLGNKPSAGGKVMLFSPLMPIIDTVTDAEGKFKFNVLVPEGVKFNVQGRSATNSSRVQVVLDKTAPEVVGINKNSPDIVTDPYTINKDFVENKHKEDQILARYGKLNEMQELAQVNIKGKKVSKVGNLNGFSIAEAMADQVFIPEPDQNCGVLWMCLQGRLRNIVFTSKGILTNWPHTRNGPDMEPMLIFLDGSKMDSLDAVDMLNSNGLDISDIEKIQVVKSSQAQMSMLGGPAILIHTKRGYVRQSNEPSIAFATPRGFSQVKEFYSPRYDVKNDPTIPDLRTTIYWNPDVRTDKSGRVKFDFFNADTKGKYKVTVEGLSASGEIGRTVINYTVE